MTTKYKVIVGFLLMICLLVATGVTAKVKLHVTSDGFAHYRTQARTAVTVNAAFARVRGMQDQYSRFRLDLNEAHIQEAKRLADRVLTEYLPKARSVETKPKEQALLDGMIAQTKEIMHLAEVMQQKLSTATKLGDEQMAARGRALSEGLSIMSATAIKVNNIALLSPIDEAYANYVEARVLVRHYVDIFLEPSAVNAEKRLAALGAALKKMEQLLISEDNKAVFVHLYKNYTDYTENFTAVRKHIQEGLEAQRQMDAAIAELRLGFVGYTERAEKEMDSVGPALEASNAQAVFLLTTVSAAGVAVGVLFAIFIIMGLIKALGSMRHFAGAIADGDFEAQATNRERGEVGETLAAMRRIPAVLQAMLGEYQNLEKSIEDGDLNAKVDPAAYKGGFSKLVAGTGAVLDRFLLLVENIPSLVVVLDANLKASYANAVCRQTVGEEYKSRTCKQLMAREDFGGPGDGLQKAVATLRPASGETRAHPQGKDLDVSYTAIPILNKEGKLASVLQLITDITAIKQTQRTIRNVADQAASIANRVATASEQLSAQVEEVARGAEQQRSRTESTATAMTEMNSTVLEVARNAGHASEQSEATRNKANDGSALVNKVVDSINLVHKVSATLQTNMQELGTQAESIGGVMNVISDIADQTNLLALNAAIEAARAGEAGRGFAVVADEVRKLAEKTMSATQEVGGNIAAIQQSARTNINEVRDAAKAVAEATDLANASGKALHEIVELASVNSSVVASIATAAEEQSATSEEISHAIEDISKIVGDTANGMVQASAAVQELSKMAQELNTVMGELR
ncbi:MAG: methyl-accepting chemotaxis protein [Deltaproteobacteria bacterium]|jgi:methyl-accepting chemotaxis protein|nr:methyl-accepting chemotaxis protein [Deltaproteobacteria bacterium]